MHFETPCTPSYSLYPETLSLRGNSSSRQIVIHRCIAYHNALINQSLPGHVYCMYS